MILLLDNYDSFTYNLAQYLGELGCNIEVHRNDRITVEEIARRNPERIWVGPRKSSHWVDFSKPYRKA